MAKYDNAISIPFGNEDSERLRVSLYNVNHVVFVDILQDVDTLDEYLMVDYMYYTEMWYAMVNVNTLYTELFRKSEFTESGADYIATVHLHDLIKVLNSLPDILNYDVNKDYGRMY